jgi:hypothetical protein
MAVILGHLVGTHLNRQAGLSVVCMQKRSCELLQHLKIKKINQVSHRNATVRASRCVCLMRACRAYQAHPPDLVVYVDRMDAGEDMDAASSLSFAFVTCIPRPGF